MISGLENCLKILTTEKEKVRIFCCEIYAFFLGKKTTRHTVLEKKLTYTNVEIYSTEICPWDRSKKTYRRGNLEGTKTLFRR